MTVVVPGSELAILRECQDRRLDREGIPMLLALVDERRGPALVGDGPPRSAGRELAERLDGYRAQLAAGQRDGDLGVVISLLQAVAYRTFTEEMLP